MTGAMTGARMASGKVLARFSQRTPLHVGERLARVPRNRCGGQPRQHDFGPSDADGRGYSPISAPVSRARWSEASSGTRSRLAHKPSAGLPSPASLRPPARPNCSSRGWARSSRSSPFTSPGTEWSRQGAVARPRRAERLSWGSTLGAQVLQVSVSTWVGTCWERMGRAFLLAPSVAKAS